MTHSPSSAQSDLSDERINELALLNLGYDRAIRTLDFARAIEREVLAACNKVPAVDREFTLYRLKVAEECNERLMSACTDSGCPDGVRMDEWIRDVVARAAASAQATGQAADLVSANPIGPTPAQKEMQREQMLRNVASKTEARFWHTNFINEFGYEPDAETAYVAGKKATPPSPDAREAGGGALTVLAQLLFSLTERQKGNVIRSEDEYIDQARALIREAGK